MMINMKKILFLYLKINYTSQKIGNPWNIEGGLVNIILMHISFILSGLFTGVYLLVGFRSLLLILFLLLILILLVWKYLGDRVKLNIDFEALDYSYQRTSLILKIIYFTIAILLIFSSILAMFYLIKILLMLR